MFQCNSGHCLPETFLCDGIADCLGDDDEIQECGMYVVFLTEDI